MLNFVCECAKRGGDGGALRAPRWCHSHGCRLGTMVGLQPRRFREAIITSVSRLERCSWSRTAMDSIYALNVTFLDAVLFPTLEAAGVAGACALCRKPIDSSARDGAKRRAVQLGF